MLQSLPMRKLNILLLDNDLMAVTREIGMLGTLQLVQVQDTSEFTSELKGASNPQAAQFYEKAVQELDEIARFVYPREVLSREYERDGAPRLPLQLRDQNYVARVIKGYREATDKWRQELVKIHDQLREYERNLTLLKMLAPTKLNLEDFQDMKFLPYRMGFLSAKRLSEMKTALKAQTQSPFALIPLKRDESGEVFFIIFFPNSAVKEVEQALKFAQFSPVGVPRGYRGPLENVIRELADHREQLEAEEERILVQLRLLRSSWGDEFLSLVRQLRVINRIVHASHSFARGERLFLISGWIPETDVPEARRRIAEAAVGKVVFYDQLPEEVEEIKSRKFKVPVAIKNPAFIQPFERLLYLYGRPEYKHVDPTIFLAISFLLMFGVMFGDVGQGLVIAGTGYLISRRMHRDFGMILAECGISSTIFGFLYGSVFGFEDLIPPLLMSPMHNVTGLMIFAVGFGILMISLGLVINMINAFRSRDWEKALLESTGLAGAVFYWSVVGIILWLVFKGAGHVNVRVILLILGIPLAVIFLKEPLHNIFIAHKKDWRPKDLKMYVISSFIEVIDTITRFFSNTVSFIRVSAFALSHAALFSAVFLLAESLRNAAAGTAGYVAMVIGGNFFILILEGMIVLIQTVRLEFYEFFSKFLEGDGEPFEPYVIEEERRSGGLG